MVSSLFIAVSDQGVDILEAIKDSLGVVVPHILEMAENCKPEPYTIKNITLASWNLVIAVLAALFGFLGALFGYLGYKFSKQTAHNVVRVSAEVQKQLCLDFIIDLYRNTMRAVKYGQACKDGEDLQTNEIVALKLPDFDDVFHIDAYNQNSDVYIIMKHLKDRMKNYNEDVRLCCDNMMNGRISLVDFQHLSFKPMHMLIMVKWLLEQMEPQKDYTVEVIEFLITKHVKHVTGNGEFLLSKSEFIADSKYYEYICTQEKLMKRIELLLGEREQDFSLVNYLRGDFECMPKMIEEYYEIVNKLPAELEYVSLMNKKEWNSRDLKSLLINIIVIDTIVDLR